MRLVRIPLVPVLWWVSPEEVAKRLLDDDYSFTSGWYIIGNVGPFETEQEARKALKRAA